MENRPEASRLDREGSVQPSTLEQGEGVLVSQRDFARFAQLRSRFLRLVRKVDDGYHKSYEGAMDLTFGFPNIFETERSKENAPDFVRLTVHCYLVIDGRHKEYTGDTLGECLDRFYEDIVKWETWYSKEE